MQGTPVMQGDCNHYVTGGPATGSEGAALGSLTGYCPSPDITQQFDHGPPTDNAAGLDMLLGSHSLRAALRPYAADTRIAICGARVFGDPVVVTDELADGSRTARWRGVILCNRAGCPVCGPAKARKFRRQVLRALSSGGTWQHVILTVPHNRGESWKTVYERVMDGVRGLSKGGCGRIVMTRVKASIRATETTWSVRSGWHVHLHCLWKVGAPLLEYERQVLREDWSRATGASMAHGVTFGITCQAADERGAQLADYLSKIALELSGAAKAAHGEHWTIGELYQRAADDGTWVGLVRQYQAQTKGKRLYQFDRRAAQLRDDAPPLPEVDVVRSYVTRVDRLEFRELSLLERRGRERLALYLPLEVAIRSRGDPSALIEDTILDIFATTSRVLN